MKRIAAVLLLVGVGSCKSEPARVEVASATETAATPVESAAPAAPIASPPAPRELNVNERMLAGTWVASVDARASRSKTMSGMLAFNLPKGKGLVDGTIEAIDKDDRMSTSCVWLELYDNLTGFRSECAIVNGDPSALEKTDPFTGKKLPLGVRFTWSADGKGVVHLVFDEDFLLPPLAGATDPVAFRKLDLRVKGAAGKDTVKVEETYPELPARPALEYAWEIYPGSYVK